MALPSVSGEFLIAAEPTLQFSPQGRAFFKAFIVANERRKNQQTQEYEDGDKFNATLEVGGELAEALASELKKFDVISLANARLSVDEWEKDGVKNRAVKIKAFGGIGKVIRAQRQQQNNGMQQHPGGQYNPQQSGNPYGGQPQQGNPYGGQPQQGNPYGGQPQQGNPYGGQPQGNNPFNAPQQGGGFNSDEPPF